MSILANYTGSKAGSGVTQWLINNMPYHEEYYELFAGGHALFRAKKRAKLSVLADIDKRVYEELRRLYGTADPQVAVSNADAGEMLTYIKALALVFNVQKQRFVYLDPPYPESSRRSADKVYKHEMLSDEEHREILELIRTVPANIMISTRQNELYDQVLHDWRKDTFDTVDRGGPTTEVIYMNYAPPRFLHQYDHLGAGYVDRQRVSRKVARFNAKINALPPYERHLFIQQLIDNDFAAAAHFLAVHDQ